MEFQRWWVLKSKILGQESSYLKDIFFNSVDESQFAQKIGHDFSNKSTLNCHIGPNLRFWIITRAHRRILLIRLWLEPVRRSYIEREELRTKLLCQLLQLVHCNLRRRYILRPGNWHSGYKTGNQGRWNRKQGGQLPLRPPSLPDFGRNRSKRSTVKK